MSVKFWEGRNSKSAFVRYDKRMPGEPEVCVWLCDEDGNPHVEGCLVRHDGHRVKYVGRDAARMAGITLNEEQQISHDSLAQICAEMAKRIQGD